MKTDELKKYFDKSNQKVLNCLENMEVKSLVKTLHELRVEIKKIRFVGHLIKHFNVKSDTEKMFKPYEKVFKVAGKIRSLQMHEKLIKQFELSDDLGDFIKENHRGEKKLLKKFYKIITSDTDVLAAYKLLIDAEIEKIAHLDLESYANHLIKFLFDNMTTQTNHKDVHEHRKKVKELIFMAGLSKKLHGYISARINLRSADKLQEKIGDWHDKHEFYITLVTKSNDIKNSELKKYRKAVKEIVKVSNKNLNEIKLLVSDFHQSIKLTKK